MYQVTNYFFSGNNTRKVVEAEEAPGSTSIGGVAWGLVGTVLVAVVVLDCFTFIIFIFETSCVQRLLHKWSGYLW